MRHGERSGSPDSVNHGEPARFRTHGRQVVLLLDFNGALLAGLASVADEDLRL